MLTSAKGDVADVLSARLGGTWMVEPHGGSGFCSTWLAKAAGRSATHDILFVKSLSTTQGAVLEAEADGLRALATAGCIRSPVVAGCWKSASLDLVVLAMEWLALASNPQRN